MTYNPKQTNAWKDLIVAKVKIQSVGFNAIFVDEKLLPLLKSVTNTLRNSEFYSTKAMNKVLGIQSLSQNGKNCSEQASSKKEKLVT